MIEVLGQGKDGIARRIGDVVSKEMSDYAKAWKFMVQEYVDADVESAHLSKVKLTTDHMIYDYEPLTHIPHDQTHDYFDQLITMEQDLLAKDLLFWDFGGVKGHQLNNYMKNEYDIVRWVDYGGNGILSTNVGRSWDLKEEMYSTPVIADRISLVHATNEFMQLMVMYHLCFSVEVNTDRMLTVGSVIQKDLSLYSAAETLFHTLLRGTQWEQLSKKIKELDLLTHEGWDDLRWL